MNNHNDLLGELGEWVDHSAKVDKAEQDADFDGNEDQAENVYVS